MGGVGRGFNRVLKGSWNRVGTGVGPVEEVGTKVRTWGWDRGWNLELGTGVRTGGVGEVGTGPEAARPGSPRYCC